MANKHKWYLTLPATLSKVYFFHIRLKFFLKKYLRLTKVLETISLINHYEIWS